MPSECYLIGMVKIRYGCQRVNSYIYIYIIYIYIYICVCVCVCKVIYCDHYTISFLLCMRLYIKMVSQRNIRVEHVS